MDPLKMAKVLIQENTPAYIGYITTIYCNRPWPGLYYSRPLAGTYLIGLMT